MPPAGGEDYELYSRVAAFDPLEQRVTREMRTILRRGGQLIAEETYTLHENLYFRNELGRMIEQAGFTIEAVQGNYQETEATAEHDFVVFVARK
jgi:hypothetical protein